MRSVVFALSLVMALTACAKAQKSERSVTGTMPPPSAGMVLENCMYQYSNTEERTIHCIGKHYDVCIRNFDRMDSSGFRRCALTEEHVWDEIRVDQYALLLDAASSTEAAKLRSNQLAWVAERIDGCNSTGTREERHIQDSLCSMVMTAERAIANTEAVIMPSH